MILQCRTWMPFRREGKIAFEYRKRIFPFLREDPADEFRSLLNDNWRDETTLPKLVQPHDEDASGQPRETPENPVETVDVFYSYASENVNSPLSSKRCQIYSNWALFGPS